MMVNILTRFILFKLDKTLAKSAKSSSFLCVECAEFNDLLKQKPQARRRPRRLIPSNLV